MNPSHAAAQPLPGQHAEHMVDVKVPWSSSLMRVQLQQEDKEGPAAQCAQPSDGEWWCAVHI